MNEAMKQKIENGEVFLGIELGSTRIKAVLIDNLRPHRLRRL